HRLDRGAGAVAQQRERRGRQRTRGGELRAKRLALGRGWQVAVPEQPGRFLERRVLRELADRIPRDDQFTPFAIDVAETGRCRDDAVEAALGHTRHASRPYMIVSMR